jgi:hypothetical protein
MFQNRSVVYHLIMKGQGFPFNFIRLMMECMFTNFCLSESKVYVSTIGASEEDRREFLIRTELSKANDATYLRFRHYEHQLTNYFEIDPRQTLEWFLRQK